MGTVIVNDRVYLGLYNQGEKPMSDLEIAERNLPEDAEFLRTVRLIHETLQNAMKEVNRG